MSPHPVRAQAGFHPEPASAGLRTPDWQNQAFPPTTGGDPASLWLLRHASGDAGPRVAIPSRPASRVQRDPHPDGPVSGGDGTCPIQPALIRLASPAFIIGDGPMGTLTGVLPMPLANAAGSVSLTPVNVGSAVGAAGVLADYGLDGSGIRIGILSDSFNLRGGYATDAQRGDLPFGVQILKEGTSGNDEGRAMADIVHAVAPGAQIMFYTATSSEDDFANGILALKAAGCNIIVDDVTYLNEPFYQDGDPIQRAVESVIASGTSYFTAAANQGANYVETAFAPMRGSLPGLPSHAMLADFGGGNPYCSFTVQALTQVVLDLQWDQPFDSIGHGPGSANSLGIAVYDASGALVAASTGSAVGRDPCQLLSFQNPGLAGTFRLAVWVNGGTAPPGLFKVIGYRGATFAGPLAGHGSGTVIGHALVPGVNTVGAINYVNTPAFNGSGALEPFSSVGPGEFLFDAAGHRLPVPLPAGKVSFVAPDGAFTSVFKPFLGTSAAAPAAAAVAALVMQADPYLSPAQVSTILAESCVPVGGSGGAGLIQAEAAVQLALAALHH